MMNKIQEAEKELSEFITEIDRNRTKFRKKKLTEDEKGKMRSSTTHSEARIMKMPDVDTKENIIVSLDVVKQVQMQDKCNKDV